jgi:hypothetical protein
MTGIREGSFVAATGQATSYGMGVLTHETLHKNMVVGGSAMARWIQRWMPLVLPLPTAKVTNLMEASD